MSKTKKFYLSFNTVFTEVRQGFILDLPMHKLLNELPNYGVTQVGDIVHGWYTHLQTPIMQRLQSSSGVLKLSTASNTLLYKDAKYLVEWVSKHTDGVVPSTTLSKEKLFNSVSSCYDFPITLTRLSKTVRITVNDLVVEVTHAYFNSFR